MGLDAGFDMVPQLSQGRSVGVSIKSYSKVKMAPCHHLSRRSDLFRVPPN